MKANGRTGLSMDRAFGVGFLETHTSANGNRAKQAATECTCGKMVIDTKANGTNVSNTAKARTSLPMETPTLASTKKASQTAAASINGSRVQSTRGTFRKG